MQKNSKYIGQVNPFWNVNLWGKYIQNQKNENNVNVTLRNATEENKKEKNKLENNIKDSSKKKGYLNYEQREYSPEFFESFYDNLRKWGKYETI